MLDGTPARDVEINLFQDDEYSDEKGMTPKLQMVKNRFELELKGDQSSVKLWARTRDGQFQAIHSLIGANHRVNAINGQTVSTSPSSDWSISCSSA